MKAHKEWYLLSAYLDHELSPEEHSEVQAHLDECLDCRHEMELLRSTKDVIAAAPRHDAPADLLAILKRGMPQPSWSHRILEVLRLPTVWIPAGALATALLAGLWFGASSDLDELPIEPLMAAHSRYAAEALVPHSDLVASNFSAQLESYASRE